MPQISAAAAETGRNLFQYISPHIYPILPRAYGRFSINYSISNLARYRITPGFTGTVTVSLRTFANGMETGAEDVPISIENGQVSKANVVREFTGDEFGYMEMLVTADKPAFTKMLLPQSYGLFNCPGSGQLTFGSDLKFAREQIVEQIATYSRFCMLQSSSYVNAAKDIGNSFILVNPYHQIVLATIATSSGKSEKIKIPKCSTILFPKQRVLDDGKWETVMITGNNRFSIFDLRHSYQHPELINNIDHIDFMNSTPVMAKFPLAKLLRRRLREGLRTVQNWIK